MKIKLPYRVRPNTLYKLKICVIHENYEHKDEKQNEKLCAFVSSWLISKQVTCPQPTCGLAALCNT